MGEMPPDTPLVRTINISDTQWDAFTAAIETESEDGFRAYVQYVADPRFIGASENDLRSEFTDAAVILVADAQTFAGSEFSVLCVDPEGRSSSFRAAAEHLWIVENNVSIGNLLFEEIAEDQVVNGWLVAD